MLGCCLPWQNAESDPAWYGRALELLHPASWYDYKFDQIVDPHYVPMLYTLRNDACMVDAIRAARDNRQRLWFLGNEQERKDQGNTEPQEAADAVASWRRRTDNPIAAPGILWDAWGQRWLEDYLNADGPTPEFWAIHIYAHTAGHWLVLWQEWREWMSWNNLELPTIVSECSSWDEDPRIQCEVMDIVRRTLSTDKLLHAAYWFSACYSPYADFWARSDLLTEDDQLTLVGEHFVGLATTYLPLVTVT